MQRFLANLHAQFFRNKTERDEKSWEWLKKEKLKKETAQDQALRTDMGLNSELIKRSCHLHVEYVGIGTKRLQMTITNKNNSLFTHITLRS